MTLDKTVKYLSIGSFLMIAASSLKLTLYYALFNINIGEYIQLNEYIVQFIYDLYYYILIFGAGLLLNLISENTLKKLKNEKLELIEKCKRDREKAIEKNEIEKVKNIDKLLEDVKDKPKKVNRVALVIISIILVAGICVSIYYPFVSLSDRYGIVLLTFIIVLCGIYIYLQLTKYEFNYKIYLAIFVIGYIVYYSNRDAQLIKENKNIIEVSLLYNDEEIKTNNSIKYIGKTEKYIFFYNLESAKTIIYSLDGINKLEIEKIKKN